VRSVNVGMPRDVRWQGRTVRTGIWKEPVEGRVMARRLNLDGDGQGDLAGHGGEQRAVMVYQAESYDYWRRQLGRDDLSYGAFGENLTIDGLPDADVCIGDRYAIGGAEFEVTQPRTTCFRVGMRLGVPQMAALLVAHHRPGFYFRVLREGQVGAGDEIVRTATGPQRLSVAATDALLYLPGGDVADLRRALDIPALSPGWHASFADLVAAAAPARPAWPGFRPMRVSRLVPETADVTSIYLAPADGAELPPAAAGQYLSLRVPGLGGPAPVRSYSLSGPIGDSYRISVKHDGLVSSYLTTALTVGSVLDVAAPRGEFVLADGTQPLVLLSAGIGVTPVLAMLHQLAAGHSTRSVWWVHAARGPDEQPLASEAARLLAELPNGHSHVFYSSAGRLTADRLAGLGLPRDGVVYLCGPAAFMDDMRTALGASGIEPSRVRTELFGALAAINPGVVGAGSGRRPHPPASPGSGPLVTFARSGLSVPYDATRTSLLEMAELCDVPTRWSCRTGVCHTCSTPLLSGEVSYDPQPLTPPEPGTALLCCSRPDSPVVLDM
jgi:ferredoxin-NADP reductase/MOSC domain-containing protein YiiM